MRVRPQTTLVQSYTHSTFFPVVAFLRLIEAIAAMGGMHARVNSILKSHGWMGNQFSGPPRMDDLMEDLESCCEEGVGLKQLPGKGS